MAGLLSYAVAGGVKGAADVYGDIKKDERKGRAAEEAEVRKEGRGMDIWDKQQERLAAIRATETESSRAYQTSERVAGEETKSTAAALKVETDAEVARKKGYSLGQGQKHFVDDTEVASVDPKPASGTGDKDRKKPFIDAALKLNKVPDMDALDDIQQLAVTRTASIASQLIRKYPDIDRDTALHAAHVHVSENPSQEADPVQGEIDAIGEKWYFLDSSKETARKRTVELEKQLAKMEKDRTDVTPPAIGDQEQATPKPMLSTQPDMIENTTPDQPVNTPPIDRLQEGKNTSFANGQVWTLKNGKPIQVK